MPVKILESKNLFREIDAILRKVKRVNHKEIQEESYNNGWELEKKILHEVTWAWDAFKDKVEDIAVAYSLKVLDARTGCFS
jgi:predicted PP-loop superfamily ATPase